VMPIEVITAEVRNDDAVIWLAVIIPVLIDGAFIAGTFNALAVITPAVNVPSMYA